MAMHEEYVEYRHQYPEAYKILLLFEELLHPPIEKDVVRKEKQKQKKEKVMVRNYGRRNYYYSR